jgi:hypothetical protein
VLSQQMVPTHDFRVNHPHAHTFRFTSIFLQVQ